MSPRHLAALCLPLIACGCHGYTPAPVDLAAHVRAFAARLPSDDGRADGTPGAFDLTDGLDLAEGRQVTLWFAPACRIARRRAGVATADEAHAGAWPDPVLGADFARILANVPYRWLAAADLGITLPLSGRLGRERALAAAQRGEALAEASLAELDALRTLTEAWVTWSAARAHADLTAQLSERLAELEVIARRLADAGQITQLAARAFTLERLQRLADADQARSDVARGERHVRQALGLHPDAPVALVPTLHPPDLAPATPAAAAAALPTSPRLWPLQQAHAKAEAALALEVRKQWPDLVLSPGWQEEDGQPRLALGLSLPLPLFAGNDGPIAHAVAQRDLAAEMLRAGAEDLVHELADADARRLAAQAQSARAAELLPLADQQLADGRRLAELGQLDPLLILDALVRAHAARAHAVDAELAEAMATIARNALFADDLTTPGPGPETTR